MGERAASVPDVLHLRAKYLADVEVWAAAIGSALESVGQDGAAVPTPAPTDEVVAVAAAAATGAPAGEVAVVAAAEVFRSLLEYLEAGTEETRCCSPLALSWVF